jgi:hypothetical protein
LLSSGGTSRARLTAATVVLPPPITDTNSNVLQRHPLLDFFIYREAHRRPLADMAPKQEFHRAIR